MAFRTIAYLIPSCDGCGLAWSFTDPACPDGIPPHFTGRAAALAELPVRYGWQLQARRWGRPLMACRRCVVAGVLPVSAQRAWLLAVAGWVRRYVPFGPVLRVAAVPHDRHPESMTVLLPAEQEELLAEIDDELFPDS